MLPVIVGLFCTVWLVCGVVVIAIGLRDRRKWKEHNPDNERDVHDGSSVVTGGLIALILGPIGLTFYCIDWWRS